MRGERERELRGGFRYNQRPSSRRYYSPAASSIGWEGPNAGVADMGWEDGEWTWVSHRRRRASRPVRIGRNDFRQGNGFNGRFSSRADTRSDSKFRNINNYFQDHHRYQEDKDRARVPNDHARGRSITRRRDRSYIRGAAPASNFTNNNAAESNQDSAVFYITNFPERLLFVDLKKGVEIDDCTINKDRLDFARILISSPSLSVINDTVNVCIANVDFSIRIIEESVLERVEDACLQECEEENLSQYSYRTGMQDEEPSVEAFVNRMQEVWVEQAEEVSKEASITVNQNNVTLNRCDSVRVKPPEVTSTSVTHGRRKQVRKKILVPSVYGIKKIARLSEEDRNALIRALKIEKRNRALKKASKGSSVAKQGTSLSAGTGSLR
ncbi:hypothetical protein P8452_75217 [Trifolium repens]|nr:hypothetical protein P8452_75217 [Trifolium repens]